MRVENKTWLRPVTLSDCERLWEWRNQNAAWFFGELGTYDEHCAFWKKTLENENEFNFIIRTYDNEDVGSISLFARPGGAEYGRFQIAKENQGKGYGRSGLFDIMLVAFIGHKKPFLCGKLFADNAIAFILCCKLGFRYGRHIDGYIEKDGVPRDIAVMEMRRYEFMDLYGKDIQWQKH